MHDKNKLTQNKPNKPNKVNKSERKQNSSTITEIQLIESKDRMVTPLALVAIALPCTGQHPQTRNRQCPHCLK